MFLSEICGNFLEKEQPEVLYGKAVLKNLAIFNIQRKTPVLESFFDKVAGQTSDLIEVRLQYRYFPLNIVKLFKGTLMQI